jgi:predicted RNA methylase
MVEEEDIEGTGTLIWSAGVRLSQHIVKNRTQELKGARVLDLGSGTGGFAGSTCIALRTCCSAAGSCACSCGTQRNRPQHMPPC